jgi:GGDEF domain-containing protein
MAKDPHSRLSSRARAVADLPIDALVARAEDLARGWAIALIRSGPMDRMGSIPLQALSSEAPGLCTQVLRALQSEVELERLTGRGASSGRERSAQARGLAEMAGAPDAEATVDAVEALRGVLWDALLDELHAPPPRLVADLADRLGYVCSCALAAAVGAIAPVLAPSSDDRDGAPAEGDGNMRAAARTGSALTDAVIVDERAEAQLPVAPARRGERTSLRSSPASDAERPLAWDESPPVPPTPLVTAPAHERPLAWDESPPVRPSGEREEIEIRDVRGEEGPAAWIGSIGRQLTRFQDDGLPFAVLLVELLEIDGLRRGESPPELAQLADRVQHVLTDELRAAASGSLTCESPGRYWLLALETDRSDADRLAERLTRAVTSSVHHRQEPVAIAIGAAICPEDGLQAPMLAAHADVGLYAARSAARAMSGRPANS